MKILVVDDERVLVKGIKFNLESEGYQVEVGYDGQAAVDMARSGSFDLILLDLMMPKIDGLQACMRIREFSNVPIIILTAKGEDGDKLIGFESGRNCRCLEGGHSTDTAYESVNNTRRERIGRPGARRSIRHPGGSTVAARAVINLPAVDQSRQLLPGRRVLP